MAAGIVRAHGLTAEQRYGDVRSLYMELHMRRLVLSGLLLAGAVFATPVAAQTAGSPGIAETMAYIRERCVGAPPGDNWYRISVSFDANADLIVTETFDNGNVYNNFIPVRFVTFWTDDAYPRVNVSCPETFLIGQCPVLRGRNARQHEFFCREREKVVNALRHLQTLRGGPAPASDPFA